MNERKFFFWFLFGAAVFIYLVGSFLVADFDIRMWKDGQRFLAVAVYLFIVWGTIRAIGESNKPSKPFDKSIEKVEKVEAQEKVEV